MKLLNPPPHNQALPSHVNCRCNYCNGPHKHAVVSGSHTHSIEQQSAMVNPNDFALLFRHDKHRIYLVDGGFNNNWIPSEKPITIEETIEHSTEMISKIIVGSDINMFIEGIKTELKKVINKKLKDLNLIEGD